MTSPGEDLRYLGNLIDHYHRTVPLRPADRQSDRIVLRRLAAHVQTQTERQRTQTAHLLPQRETSQGIGADFAAALKAGQLSAPRESAQDEVGDD